MDGAGGWVPGNVRDIVLWGRLSAYGGLGIMGGTGVMGGAVRLLSLGVPSLPVYYLDTGIGLRGATVWIETRVLMALYSSLPSPLDPPSVSLLFFSLISLMPLFSYPPPLPVGAIVNE